MAIETGIYNIKAGNLYVGRHVIEDRSLLPKRVLSLPEGFEAPRWKVKSKNAGKYTLTIDGARIGFKKEDDRVYAFLLDDENPVDWEIKPVGDNLSSISANGKFMDLTEEAPETHLVVSDSPKIEGLSFELSRLLSR